MSSGEFAAYAAVSALAVASMLISLGMLFRPQLFPRLIVCQAACMSLICMTWLFIGRVWP